MVGVEVAGKWGGGGAGGVEGGGGPRKLLHYRTWPAMHVAVSGRCTSVLKALRDGSLYSHIAALYSFKH